MVVDIGRKKDLTVLWVVELLGDVLYTRAVIAMEKMRKSAQEDILYPWFAIADRICIDATGLGIGWSDDAQEQVRRTPCRGGQFLGSGQRGVGLSAQGGNGRSAAAHPG